MSDCLFWEAVECPYASGYQACKDIHDDSIEVLDCYVEDTRVHPLDDGDRGDYLYECEKDRRTMEGE